MVSVSESQGKQVQAAMQPDESIDAAPLQVMIVDDSKLIRKVLRQIIEADGNKKVVAEAEDGKQALDMLMDKKPDVITLDINMQVMDGLTALKHIMIKRPTPTVMISALTKEGALETFDALKYGAIDFLPKPSQVKGADLNAQRENIVRKLELAAAVQIVSVRYLRRPSKDKDPKHHTPEPCRFVVSIGATDGGYGSLLNMVPGLRGDLPAAYVAVLHQAPQHVEAFVSYLDRCSQLEVRRAKDGMPLNTGVCYLAALDECVCFEKKGEETVMRVNAAGSPEQECAVNLMMQSATAVMQDRAAGVILS
ncbi:MAG: response regulator, partial [Desulfosarcinaceae bacterium]